MIQQHRKVPKASDTDRRESLADEVIERGMRGRLLKSVALFPVMLTLGNGLAGFASIHFATKAGGAENLALAAWMIVLAMVCDMLDGQVARFANRTSDFGAQLDSLCDAISFGVAPAVLMLRTVVPELLPDPVALLSFERVIWGVAGLYVACAVLRLARFNVEHDSDTDEAHLDFTGLPSPAAAATILTLVLLTEQLRAETWATDWPIKWWLGLGLPTVTLLVGLLMVSRVPYPHVVNRYVRGKKPFHHAIRFVLIGLAALFALHFTLALLALGFAVSGPLGVVIAAVRRPPAEAGA